MKIVDSFELAVSSVKMGSKELQFADQIIIFLSEQSKGIKLGECFIGSTEALESLFGKIKYMEHEQTSFGFTSLVLAAMACVGPTNEKIIEEAMISIKLSDVEEWAAKEIGQSVQAQRRKIKKIIADLVIKLGQKVSGIHEEAVA